MVTGQLFLFRQVKEFPVGVGTQVPECRTLRQNLLDAFDKFFPYGTGEFLRVAVEPCLIQHDIRTTAVFALLDCEAVLREQVSDFGEKCLCLFL